MHHAGRHLQSRQQRLDEAREHRFHLARRSRQAHHGRAADLRSKTGGRARVVGQALGGRGPHRLPTVDVGHRATAIAEPAIERHERRLVEHERRAVADRLAEGVARQIVVGRAQTSGHQHDLRHRRERPQRVGLRRQIVGHRAELHAAHATVREPPREPARVRVLRLAQRDFVTDGEDGRVHDVPVEPLEIAVYCSRKNGSQRARSASAGRS